MADEAQSQREDSSAQGELAVTLTELKKWHQLLIHHYVRILKEVSELHPIGGRGYKQELYGGDAGVWRAFVRWFVEAHIRRQLSALSSVYLLQQGTQNFGPAERGWLDEAHKSCEKILTAIPSRQRAKLLLATASPLVVGLLAAALGVDNIYQALMKAATSQQVKARIQASSQNAVLVIYVFLVALLFFLPFATSFAYKRGLFYPPVRYHEATSWSKRRMDMYRKLRGLTKSEAGANVYEIEDELFKLLSFGKAKEPQVDVVVTVLTFMAALVTWLLFAIAARRQVDAIGLAVFSIVVVAVCSLAIARALQVAQQRAWR